MMGQAEPAFTRTVAGERRKLRRISEVKNPRGSNDLFVVSRERLARKVRNMMRQCRPITLITPRWSGVEGFLDTVLPSLSGLEIETISTPNLVGKAPVEAWNFLLQALCSLTSEAAPIVLEQRAFQAETRRILAHIPAYRGLALLGAERLPMPALLDLSQLWGTSSTSPLLISSSLQTPALEPLMGEAEASGWVVLDDYSEAETATLIQRRAGLLPPDLLSYAVRFTGGVPALVEAVAAGLAVHWPKTQSGWWASLGPLGEDLKAAIEVSLASPDLAERLFMLRDGRQRAMEARDQSLLLSGLLRQARAAGPARVQLRAQALAFLAAPEL